MCHKNQTGSFRQIFWTFLEGLNCTKYFLSACFLPDYNAHPKDFVFILKTFSKYVYSKLYERPKIHSGLLYFESHEGKAKKGRGKRRSLPSRTLFIIQALKHKLEKCIPNIRSSEPTFCQYSNV